jgi:hypothetical protein
VTERAAELLATMAEDVAHEAQKGVTLERRERGTRVRSQRDDGGAHLGRGPEGTRRHAAHDPRLGERLHEHRQIAALLAGRRGSDHAARDLLLNEHDDERGPPIVPDEALQQRRGYLVRNVRDDPCRAPLGQGEQVHFERVGAHDRDVLMGGKRVAEDRDHALVDLDRNDGPRERRQLGGEHARPRPDLQDVVVGRELSGHHDVLQDGAVDEKALPERGRGTHAVPAQDALELAGIGDVHVRCS